MNKSDPTVQKTLLLNQMAADRMTLIAAAPPRVSSDFRLAPKLKPWAIPTVLFALTLLKLPRPIKAPLRALAVLMFKNRVQEIVRAGRSKNRTHPRLTHLPVRQE